MVFQEKAKPINIHARALRDIFRYPALVSACAAILMLSSFLLVSRMQSFYFITHGVAACIADAFVSVNAGYSNAMGMSNYLIIPLFLFLVVFLIRSDDNPQIILRSWTRNRIWIYQCCKVFWLSVTVSIIATATTFVAGMVQADSTLNWHLENTVYWVATGETLGHEINVLLIMAAFMMVTFLTLLFSGLLFILLNLAFSNILLGWAAVMAFCFVDGIYLNLFYSNVSMQYELWGNGYPAPNILLLAVSCISVLFAAGCLVVRKKEFS